MNSTPFIQEHPLLSWFMLGVLSAIYKVAEVNISNFKQKRHREINHYYLIPCIEVFYYAGIVLTGPTLIIKRTCQLIKHLALPH